MKFENKVAIVTGATSGIGRSIARKFAEEGAKVVFCGRREDRGLEFEKELNDEGFDTFFVKADITEEDDIKNLFEKTIEKYGKIDVLVNNAGILRHFDIKEMDVIKDLYEVIETNLIAYFVTTKYAFNHMTEGGAIVNIASIGGLSGTPNLSTYGASKAGVVSLTKSAAKEGGAMGIRTNAVCPGTIITEMMHEDDPLTQMSIQMIPLARSGEPTEVADLVAYLASDDASFVNGAIVTVDGGLSA